MFVHAPTFYGKTVECYRGAVMYSDVTQILYFCKGVLQGWYRGVTGLFMGCYRDFTEI